MSSSPSPALSPVAAQAHPYRPDPQLIRSPRARPPLLPARPAELLAALACVAVVDVGFWSGGQLRGGGPGLALLLTLAPVLFFVAARRARPTLRLLIVTTLLTLTVARTAYLPTPTAVLSGLALLFAFTVALRGRGGFLPQLAGSLLHAFNFPARFGMFIAGAAGQLRRTRVGRLRLAPVLVPLALVALFAGVFALANPLVARGVESAWELVTRWVAVPSPLRIVLWTMALAASALLLRPAVLLSRATESAESTGAASDGSIVVARNALLALNALFLAYNALDAAYLWAGAPPPGVSTQHYAHAGAAWLTVALAALTCVVGVLFRGALAHDGRARLARGLAFAWLGQGFVLAAGAYRRIAIHVAWSGLSNLRIVGVLGTTLVVVGLVLVALKLRRRRTFTWLLRRQLDAFALTFVLFSVAPTHLLSARVNVARIARGEQRPLLHMFRQSAEAESTTSLLPLLDHTDVRIRQGIAALLLQERAVLRSESQATRSWRERDGGTVRALATLDEAAPRLESILGQPDRHWAARAALFELSETANAAE